MARLAAALARAAHGEGPVADALLAAALLLAHAALTAPGGGDPWWAGWLALGVVPVALRRRWPLAAVAAGAAHTAASVTWPQTLPPAGLAVVVLTYTAATRWSLPRAAAAAGLLWAPALAAAAAHGPGWAVPGLPHGQDPTFTAMTAAVCFLAGRTVANRRATIAALEERASAAEAGRAALAAQVVADERRRIARELHDIVAHHISVAGVLAAGTRRALHRDPPAADQALAAIEQTCRTVQLQMRRLLGVLRDGQDTDSPLGPQPGGRAVADLVAQVREAGLPVELHADPAVAGLGPVAGLTVYRVVQEALTNVLRHAGPATARVRLSLVPGAVEVEVTDTGRGPAPGPVPAGHGLLGMRERVALHGGQLRVGPHTGGGFRVCATIPVEVADCDTGS